MIPVTLVSVTQEPRKVTVRIAPAGPIGSFEASVVQIDMTSSSGALKSKTSDLSKDGTSFSEAFYSPGP